MFNFALLDPMKLQICMRLRRKAKQKKLHCHALVLFQKCDQSTWSRYPTLKSYSALRDLSSWILYIMIVEIQNSLIQCNLTLWIAIHNLFFSLLPSLKTSTFWPVVCPIVLQLHPSLYKKRNLATSLSFSSPSGSDVESTHFEVTAQPQHPTLSMATYSTYLPHFLRWLAYGNYSRYVPYSVPPK